MLSLYEEGQMKIKSLNGKLIWHTHYNWGLYPLVQGCRLTTFFMIWSCLLLLWWWSSFQIASIFSWQGWIHYCIWTENKYISVISFIHIIIYQDEVAWFWRVKFSQSIGSDTFLSYCSISAWLGLSTPSSTWTSPAPFTSACLNIKR